MKITIDVLATGSIVTRIEHPFQDYGQELEAAVTVLQGMLDDYKMEQSDEDYD